MPVGLGLLLLAAAQLSASASEARPAIFAVVVGNRLPAPGSPRDLKALEFADDDAVRWWRFFREYVEDESDAVLLVDPDERTQTRPGNAEAMRRRRAPTTEELRAAFETIRRRLQAASDAGRPTRFYFVFSGHGSRDASVEGALHLERRLTREELHLEYLAKLPRGPRHFTQLVLDACESYYVAYRGPRGEAAVREALDRGSPERFRNVGRIVLSRATPRTQEYSLYRAGILSHLLLSALTGAANLGPDTAVSYRELGAFLATALAHEKLEGHIQPLVAEPPEAVYEPFIDLSWRRRDLPRLRIAADAATRFWVDDDANDVRLLDFHKAPGTDAALTLDAEGAAYVRREEAGAGGPVLLEARIDLSSSWPARKEWEYSDLVFAPASPTARKGGLEEALVEGLFAVPYGPSSVAMYVASRAGAEGAREEPARSGLRRWAWAAGGLASGALASGGALWLHARSRADDLATTPTAAPDTELAAIRDEVQLARGLAAGGALVGLAAGLLFVAEF